MNVIAFTLKPIAYVEDMAKSVLNSKLVVGRVCIQNLLHKMNQAR